MELRVDVDTRGPVFNGLAEHELEAFRRDAIDDIAAQGYANVMTILNTHIKHPTPYYETQIITERRGDTRIIHDRGIVYGPWLEGISERNRTTSFKGYAAFRRGKAQLERQVPDLLQHALEPHLRRMQ